MNDITIRAGEQLRFTVTQADPDSISATAIFQSDTAAFSDTVTYSDGTALFVFNSPDTDIVGTYEYQINENFADGTYDIYPSPDGCSNGNCKFPTLEICPSLQTEGS